MVREVPRGEEIAVFFPSWSHRGWGIWLSSRPDLGRVHEPASLQRSKFAMSRAIAAGVQRLTGPCVLNGHIWKRSGRLFGLMQNTDEWKMIGVGGFFSLFASAGTDDGWAAPAVHYFQHIPDSSRADTLKIPVTLDENTKIGKKRYKKKKKKENPAEFMNDFGFLFGIHVFGLLQLWMLHHRRCFFKWIPYHELRITFHSKEARHRAAAGDEPMAGKAAEEDVNKCWFGECLHAHGLRLQTHSGCRSFPGLVYIITAADTDKQKQSHWNWRIPSA